MKKLRFGKTTASPLPVAQDDGSFVVPIGNDPVQVKALALWQQKEAAEKIAADEEFRLKNRWCRCGHNEFEHYRSSTRWGTKCNTYYDCKKNCPAFLLERTTNGVS